jgi:hypothetical protein
MNVFLEFIFCLFGQGLSSNVPIEQGAWKLIGENLKVVWA